MNNQDLVSWEELVTLIKEDGGYYDRGILYYKSGAPMMVARLPNAIYPRSLAIAPELRHEYDPANVIDNYVQQGVLSFTHKAPEMQLNWLKGNYDMRRRKVIEDSGFAKTTKELWSKLWNFKRDRGQISDGYHTFNELYEHRNLLWINLCVTLFQYLTPPVLDITPNIVWKSKIHSDGSSYEGWFLLGMNWKYGQCSYHIPDKYWDLCGKIPILEKAPEWDGHTPNDVIDRLIQRLEIMNA